MCERDLKACNINTNTWETCAEGTDRAYLKPSGRGLNISLKRDAEGRHFISNLSKRLFSLKTPAEETTIRVSDYITTREDAKNKSNERYPIVFRRRRDDY